MSVEIPADPAPKGYIPNPYQNYLDRAKTRVHEEAASTSGWESVGTKEGVVLEKKAADGAGGLPIVRGKAVLEGITPTELWSVISLPACREKWDARFEAGYALERYSQRSFKFYSVQKGSWPVSPRDLVGAQDMEINEDGSLIVLAQTSVPDNEKTPPVSGMVRASLDFAGWVLKQEGSNTDVTYVVHINLNGTIPTWMVERVLVETPLCVARVRDFLAANGSPPVLPTLSLTQLCAEGINLSLKEWTANLYGKGAEEFVIPVDGKKMYSAGWVAMVRGEATEDVGVDKEGNTLTVKVGEGAKDKKFDIVIGST